MENPKTEGCEEDSSKNISAPANMESKLHNAYTVDCKFIVGEKLGVPKTVFGHKLLFSLNSEVFESMFSGNFLEAKCTEIALPDDDPNAFQLNVSDTIGLYKLCDKYMIMNIKKFCADHLRKYLSGDDNEDHDNDEDGDYGQDVDDYYGQLIELFAFVMEFPNPELLKEIEEKLSMEDYPLLEAVFNFNPITFLKYLEIKVNRDHTYHLPIFNAIEKYLTYNNLIPQELLKSEKTKQSPSKNFNGQENVVFLSDERQMELLEQLLTLVDFARISIQEFISGPGVSKILTCEQKYYILSQLCADPQPSYINLYQN
ncbi:BTB/POZ domain-containing protein 2-like isoform X2 [Musca autumnalis]|uniref:BTB/POZ domain-containing protein 2-like isoform X2 n=1 Tax=Musca autumnalis TaxID=221902 RepID=UPI003CF38670